MLTFQSAQVLGAPGIAEKLSVRYRFSPGFSRNSRANTVRLLVNDRAFHSQK